MYNFVADTIINFFKIHRLFPETKSLTAVFERQTDILMRRANTDHLHILRSAYALCYYNYNFDTYIVCANMI